MALVSIRTEGRAGSGTRIGFFLIYLALFLLSLAAAALVLLNFLTETRGVEPRTQPLILGTNLVLEPSTPPADISRMLELVKRAHLTAVRLSFPWREIEKQRGQYDWARWDELVRQVRAAGLDLVAVLDTAPAWAQREDERDLPGAPPLQFEDYAAFAASFARRYAADIRYYEIWDEPNVHPGWGKRNADPADYARLLHLAAQAIRATDPDARIVLAGLAMNLELQRPHPDYSEVLFLRGLYEAGAASDFDVVAAKPYGMWTGPQDRGVSASVLNFSRLILLREEMTQHGDSGKPLWAVEAGWNALPPGWQGPPSPWGSDDEPVQADRLIRGLARARDEWGWLGAAFPMLLSSDLPPDDPRAGFNLVSAQLEPRPLYAALAGFASNAPAAGPVPVAPPLPLALLLLTALVSAARGLRLAPGRELASAWTALESRFARLPKAAQFAILVTAVAAFYLSPFVPLNFLILALLLPLFMLRLDLGLALAVFAIPFFLHPKRLFGSFELSMVEVLTLVTGAAWLLRSLLLSPEIAARDDRGEWRLSLLGRVRSQLARWTRLDWAVLLLVLLGLVSTRIAMNFGVANRELRVIIAEPALLYLLVRVLAPSSVRQRRLVNALLLAGALVCAIGLYQFLGGDVIVADGLSRVRAVWGSPNNAALFLGRLLPIALALALFYGARAQRWFSGAVAVLLAATIYLTYSRGALLLGVPAGLLVLGLLWAWRQRGRLRLSRTAVVLLVVGCGLVIAAAASTARVQSLFQAGTGTGFFRVAVWTSALNMLRDHPLTGVGLDNFLYEYPKYMLPEAWREPNLSHPHNVFLDFWLRLGILGVPWLLWTEFEFFRAGWRTFRAADAFRSALAAGLMASMADFLAHGLIDAAYYVVDLAFVFMLSLALVARPQLKD